MSLLLIIVGIILVIAGLPGIFIPALPGIPMAFLGYILIAWGRGFNTIHIGIYILLSLLTLLSVIADYLASSIATKRAGGSGTTAIAAFLGMFIGIVSGQLYLMFLLPFVFAFLVEFVKTGNMKKGIRVGLYAFAGFLGSVVFRVLVYFMMLGLFIYGLTG